jgi:hypothetical protein
LGATLALGACTDDGAALHVICSIQPEVSEDGCLFDPESETCVFKGRMNLAVATSYTAALRVESGLKPRNSNSPPRAEPNRINLTGGEVELRKTNGAPIKFRGLKNPYPFVGSGSVIPEEFGAMSVTLIPYEYVDQLRENARGDEPIEQILLAVKVKGVTDGQVAVESGEWIWPVQLDYLSPAKSENACNPAIQLACSSLLGINEFSDICLCDDVEDDCSL